MLNLIIIKQRNHYNRVPIIENVLEVHIIIILDEHKKNVTVINNNLIYKILVSYSLSGRTPP